MRWVTKCVFQLIHGITQINTLPGEAQSADEMTSTTESDGQSTVNNICTWNYTFFIANNRTCVDTKMSSFINSFGNYRYSHVDTPLTGKFTVDYASSTQSPIFKTQSDSSLFNHDENSLKRKSDVIDTSKISRKHPKTLSVNYDSLTPTLDSVIKQPATTNSLKISFNSDIVTNSNDILITSSSKETKSRENRSQYRKSTTTNASSPSFNWDTFVNYGELSEHQQLIAQLYPFIQVKDGG